MNTVVVHVVRPYATEQEYLAAEAWSIDARSMLLIDAETLPLDTAVLFDIALADGHKPIRAEGRVVADVPPSGSRPGGLRVKFKRFGAATKAFIERAVASKTGGREAEQASQPRAEPPSAPRAEPPSVVEVERISMVDMERPSLPELRASMTDLEVASSPHASSAAIPERESGVNQRKPGPIAAPVNREELLARLRLRQKAG